MAAWSRSEAQRTLDEVRRRSVLDPEFRALALNNPLAAIARVNPRPVSPGTVRFVEQNGTAEEIYTPNLIVMALPQSEAALEEISEDKLEQVAGGATEAPVKPPQV